MENYRKFLLSEAMPCDGCIHNEKCATKKIACYAFAYYVYTGKDDWTLPRSPNKNTYARVMFTHDGSLVSTINRKLKELA